MMVHAVGLVSNSARARLQASADWDAACEGLPGNDLAPVNEALLAERGTVPRAGEGMW